MATFTRHRFQRPGAPMVTVRRDAYTPWNPENPTAIKFSHRPWPVTHYSQLLHVLRLLPPSSLPPCYKIYGYFVVLWVGEEEKVLPTVLPPKGRRRI
jgi:hypothetical protein